MKKLFVVSLFWFDGQWFGAGANRQCDLFGAG